MDIFRKLDIKPILKEPAIWVKRLAIFRRAEPGAEPIRDVRLESGVNIVWAREEEEDSGEAPITGHSAGKTTFCRLFRHCLGERTFGTVASTRAIADAFPEGCVAAELRVLGRSWAVMRPIGSGLHSYTLEGASIEELLQNGGKRTAIETYSASLGIDALMDRLEGSGLAKSGDQVEWDHILAWCSRDQEARFRNLHEWRSVRSESEAAGFRFKKAGPMLVMRMALGLYEAEEISGEERLADVQVRRDKLTKELEEAQREPEYLARLHTEEVRGYVAAELSEVADLSRRKLRSADLEECLSRLARRASTLVGARIAKREVETQTAEAAIEASSVEEGAIKERMRQYQAIVDLTGAVGDAEDGDATELSFLEKTLASDGEKTCPYARVLIKECTDIAKRIGELRGSAIRDAHEQEQAEARRAEVLRRAQAELATEESRLKTCQERRKRLKDDVKGMEKAQVVDRARLAALETAVSNAVKWDDVVLGGGATERIGELRKALADLEREQKDLNEKLNRSLKQHDENRDLLTRIFSSAVKSVLPATEYDGLVQFEDRTLRFSVSRGEAMTGEAVETLSILLADLSCLIYNAVNKRSCLPGFLVHDSPREADLGARIYRQFVRFIVAQQHHFATRGVCPFQYILTTTTPPPHEFQDGDEFVKLRLNAAVEQELLLRRNVAVKMRQAELF